VELGFPFVAWLAETQAAFAMAMTLTVEPQ
jgi:hypothetical protein